MFKFERKAGLAEVLSSASLLVAGYALYQTSQSNSAQLVASTENASSLIHCEEPSKSAQVLLAVPLRLINNGGRTASFVGLAAMRGSPSPVLATAGGETESPTADIRLGVPPKDKSEQRSLYEQSTKDLIGQTTRVHLSQDLGKFNASVSVPVGPGESVVLPVVIVVPFSSESHGSYNGYSVLLEARFSGGQVLPIRVDLRPPRARGFICMTSSHPSN